MKNATTYVTQAEELARVLVWCSGIKTFLTM